MKHIYIFLQVLSPFTPTLMLPTKSILTGANTVGPSLSMERILSQFILLVISMTTCTSWMSREIVKEKDQYKNTASKIADSWMTLKEQQHMTWMGREWSCIEVCDNQLQCHWRRLSSSDPKDNSLHYKQLYNQTNNQLNKLICAICPKGHKMVLIYCTQVNHQMLYIKIHQNEFPEMSCHANCWPSKHNIYKI